MMTDAEKLFALTEILGDVIHTLEMKQYDIEDPQLSHECVTDADKFHQRMIDILHNNAQ
jgi:NADP-dependent 3-hydroxy acid dehydrogenase YdfG